MSLLSNFIYNFHVIPMKIPAGLFVNIDKLILKYTWRDKTTRIAKNNIEEEEKIGNTDTILLQDLLLSYSNQHSVIFVKEEAIDQ